MRVIRAFQAIACELLIGLIAVINGVGVYTPNKGIQFRLLEGAGIREWIAMGLICSGAVLCYGAIRSTRGYSRTTASVRTGAALVLNICWFALGKVFVDAHEWVPILYFYALFFIFGCLLTLDHWE